MKEKIEAANIQLCGILEDIRDIQLCGRLDGVVAEPWQADAFSRIKARVEEIQKCLSKEQAET